MMHGSMVHSHCLSLAMAQPYIPSWSFDMQGLIDFQGFFLEDDVHYAAHEPKFEPLKLEAVEAETKFTDSQIMARLQGIFAIK